MICPVPFMCTSSSKCHYLILNNFYIPGGVPINSLMSFICTANITISFLRKPVGATVNIYFSDRRYLIIWQPPLNYMAVATLLSSGRHLIIWRPPLNYMAVATYLSGAHHLIGRQMIKWRRSEKYIFTVAPTGFRT